MYEWSIGSTDVDRRVDALRRHSVTRGEDITTYSINNQYHRKNNTIKRMYLAYMKKTKTKASFLTSRPLITVTSDFDI